ncbi:CU044_5270 family protein [Streptomyces erythrochromogenes]|uniref:CU044_5270 family protein n=1 Tax=Streptomyces erythrochromogenes TaxID=285574 RepID=UPI0036F89AD2
MNDTPELLTADRHRLLREHLMSETAGQTTKVTGSRRKLVWWVAPPLAVVAVAAVTLVGPGRNDGSAAPAVAPAASTSAAPTGSATPVSEPTDAAGLLSRAAKAAASRPDPGAKNTQFTYQRMVQDGARESRHERTMWMAVDGRSKGLIADPSMSGPGDEKGRVTWPATLGAGRGAPTQAGFPALTYEFVAALPTDPDRLLQQLLAADRSKQVVGMPITDERRHQFAFGDIQMIFMNVTAPPAVAGSLMETAARIPGTRVVADEVDAAGRHGVAVVGRNGNLRVSLIFDRTTGVFLGVRQVLLAELPPIGADGLPPAGDPSPGAGNGKGYDFATAVLKAGIVDHAGDEPEN